MKYDGFIRTLEYLFDIEEPVTGKKKTAIEYTIEKEFLNNIIAFNPENFSFQVINKLIQQDNPISAEITDLAEDEFLMYLDLDQRINLAGKLQEIVNVIKAYEKPS